MRLKAVRPELRTIFVVMVCLDELQIFDYSDALEMFWCFENIVWSKNVTLDVFFAIACCVCCVNVNAIRTNLVS